jgi:hypothetical protein
MPSSGRFRFSNFGQAMLQEWPNDASSHRVNLTVLRIDPRLWELQLTGTGLTGETAGHTAREWCETRKLMAAINVGMFKTDGTTHVGFMRFREHVNNAKVISYQSVAAFAAREPGSLAPFRIFDLDSLGIDVRRTGASNW